MIIREFYATREDGVRLFRTYSDADFKIRNDATGALYDEAVDVENSGNTYTETDIPTDDEVANEDVVRILIGGDTDETA